MCECVFNKPKLFPNLNVKNNMYKILNFILKLTALVT